MAATRSTKGRFKKGQSGNPGGRPRLAADLAEVARAMTDDALGTLQAICLDPEAPAAARVSAASAILDRGYGRPVQPAELSGPDGEPLEVSYDLSRFSLDELRQLHAFAARAQGAGESPG